VGQFLVLKLWKNWSNASDELVKLRYFIGMTIEEAASVLGISERTAKYYWTHAPPGSIAKSNCR
jgi:hypothetical protein